MIVRLAKRCELCRKRAEAFDRSAIAHSNAWQVAKASTLTSQDFVAMTSRVLSNGSSSSGSQINAPMVVTSGKSRCWPSIPCSDTASIDRNLPRRETRMTCQPLPASLTAAPRCLSLHISRSAEHRDHALPLPHG